MTLVISEREKKELKEHYDHKKLSYFEYKQLHYLFCLHESLVNIAHNFEQIIGTETIRKSLPK